MSGLSEAAVENLAMWRRILDEHRRYGEALQALADSDLSCTSRETQEDYDCLRLIEEGDLSWAHPEDLCIPCYVRGTVNDVLPSAAAPGEEGEAR